MLTEAAKASNRAVLATISPMQAQAFCLKTGLDYVTGDEAPEHTTEEAAKIMNVSCEEVEKLHAQAFFRLLN